MKKKLVTLLLALCCTFSFSALSACVYDGNFSLYSTGDSSSSSENDGSSEEAHTHDFNIPKKGVTYHWTECSCGAQTEKVAHTFVEGVCSCGAEEINGTEGLAYTLSDDETYYILSGIGTATDTDIVIPATYNNLPVTAIGEGAFRYCESVTSIVIHEDITSIGGGAFAFGSIFGGSGQVGSNGTVIRRYSRLESVLFAEDSRLTTIGEVAFSGCESLASIEIPKSVTTIGEMAFSGCANLTNIAVDNDNSNYKSIDGNLYTKDGTTLIQYLVGKKETSFTLPDSVTAIGDYALAGGSSLTSVVMGNNVTTIGKYAFYACAGLTSIAIPENVTTIKEYAFFYCMGLTGVEVPNSVTTLGEGAFAWCYNLTSITMGKGVTSIGVNPFNFCIALSSITVDTDNPNYKSVDGNLYSKDGATLVQYAPGKAATSFAVPDGVTAIGEYAFRGCYNLTSVTFGENSKLTTIGDYAFEGAEATRLTSIEIPEGVTSIGKYAFGGCTRLTSIVIPASVITLGEGAFNDCWSLESVTFGENSQLTTIGDEAFSNSGFTSIVIPDSVTTIGYRAFWICQGSITFGENSKLMTIGDQAFDGCYGLTGSIKIPDNVTTIGKGAFNACYYMTSVEIPDSVTLIGGGAFACCDSLTSITVDSNNPNYKSIDGNLYTKDGATLVQYAAGKTATSFTVSDGVTAIGDYAFHDCYKLTSVEIPASVTSIGDYAFCGCDNLTSVEIPASVASIGNSAFSSCDNLASVMFAENSQLTTIGKLAFESCYDLKSIVIPDSVTSIGDEAFYGCHKLVEIVNQSSLSIKAGSIDYGQVGYYAKQIITDESESNFIKQDEYIFYNDNETYYLLGYEGTKTQLVLPEDINGNNYSIYQYAFFDCQSLTSIVIPHGVISIGDCAFNDCQSLTSVTFSENSQLTFIGEGAFECCYDLTSIVIPDSVTLIECRAFSILQNATFENTSGWTVVSSNGTANAINSDELADTATAGEYLTYIYWNYTWTRSDD